jgi:hypothetical protein
MRLRRLSQRVESRLWCVMPGAEQTDSGQLSALLSRHRDPNRYRPVGTGCEMIDPLNACDLKDRSRSVGDGRHAVGGQHDSVGEIDRSPSPHCGSEPDPCFRRDDRTSPKAPAWMIDRVRSGAQSDRSAPLDTFEYATKVAVSNRQTDVSANESTEQITDHSRCLYPEK